MELGSLEHKKVLLTDASLCLRAVVHTVLSVVTAMAAKKSSIKEVDPKQLEPGTVNFDVGHTAISVTYKFPVVSCTLTSKGCKEFSDVFRLDKTGYDEADMLVVLYTIARENKEVLTELGEDEATMAFIDDSISEMVELLHEAKNAEKMGFGDVCKFALNATSIAVARKEEITALIKKFWS